MADYVRKPSRGARLPTSLSVWPILPKAMRRRPLQSELNLGKEGTPNDRY